MGEPYLLKAFVVVVLGGLGSVHGAVVAGMLLGIFQNLAVAYLPSADRDHHLFAAVPGAAGQAQRPVRQRRVQVGVARR
jgi:branched-subunit amino acid ABC-type transport system permease component